MAPPRKIYLDDEERALVKRAMAKCDISMYALAKSLDMQPPQVKKWMKTGKCLSALKATKIVAWAEDTLGEALDEAKRAEAVARAENAEARASWRDNVAKIEAVAREICEQAEPTFDPEPYPETTAEPIHVRELRYYAPPAPAKPEPDPHQVVLCALGVAQLEYAMGQRGFHLPEGFRWVVGVERVAG